ncbi:MAG: glycosyltransferase [Eubacteriales bacterium]
MKKILIVMHAMELGGAEKSLIGLLNAVDPTRYQIDLFLMRHEGELLKDIPQTVNLLPEISQYTVLERPMVETLREGKVRLTLARLRGKIAAARYNKVHHLEKSDVAIEYSHKYTWRLFPPIQPDTVYDLAISYLTPHYIVAGKVRAKKKIAWIHTDYAKISIDVPSEERMWGQYDNIISISDAVSRSFISVFPKLKNRLVRIDNILPAKMICRESKETVPDGEMPDDGSVRVLSVGRYTDAKNFDNVPDICHRVRKLGMNIKWYIIGYGPDEALIKSRIRESGMEEYVILLGKKENPYPYMRRCDLYAQPSRYEGNCVSVHEAQMLGKPVVIAKYQTSAGQLEDGIDGVILPQDNEDFAEGMVTLLRDPERMRRLVENCLTRDYSKRKEVEKLYALIP